MVMKCRRWQLNFLACLIELHFSIFSRAWRDDALPPIVRKTHFSEACEPAVKDEGVSNTSALIATYSTRCWRLRCLSPSSQSSTLPLLEPSILSSLTILLFVLRKLLECYFCRRYHLEATFGDLYYLSA